LTAEDQICGKVLIANEKYKQNGVAVF